MFTNTKSKNQPKTADPIGELLLNTLVDQIEDFLETPVEKRINACKDLFSIKAYPAGLVGNDETNADPSKYDVYLMQRSVRMNHDDPTTHKRLSCDIVVIDRETNIPMYYCKAYITQDDFAGVEIYCAIPDFGVEYNRTLRWTNRD